MEKVTTVWIDLAKNVFSLHGVDQLGRVLLKKTVFPRAVTGCSLKSATHCFTACSSGVR